MKPSSWRIVVGGLLLVMGALALLQNLNVLNYGGQIWGLFFALIFIAGGAMFLSALVTNRTNWWAAIPGIILIGLGITIAIPALFPALPDWVSGGIFLVSIGAAFWVVYFMSPQNWWAIIPGGTLITLAVVTALGSYNGFASGGAFFIGLGITFALLALIPSIRMKWAWIPAGILAALGLLLFFSAFAASIIWPILLIAIGAYFIYRSFRHRW
jgi:hypothetical protein